MFLRTCVLGLLVLGMIAPDNTAGAIVSIRPDSPTMLPDDSLTLEIAVDSSDAIFGYTLQLTLTPEASAEGTLSFDVGNSDWGDPVSLIEPTKRDATFTELKLNGDDLFANTNTSDLSAVVPVAGINDILLRATIVSSSDAYGWWTLSFVPGVSVLSDVNFRPIDAAWDTERIFVPEPATLAVLVSGSLLALRRRG
jgi:hypothetical protein